MNLKRFLQFFISLIFLFSTSLAQPMGGEDILQTIFPVAFVLVFILILLWIGGVIRPTGAGRFPFLLILFIISIVVLFVVPQYIPYPSYVEVPENFKMVPLPEYAARALVMLGLPSEWMYLPAIIYLFILPFAGIYAVVWAFLTSIRIFEGLSNVNRVLAFIITFLTIPVGWFTKIVWVTFSFMGIWSVVIFAATFILSTFFRGYGLVEKERYEAMAKRWRAEARRHLENALEDIKNKQASGAINELNAAKNFSGFHSDYYKQLETAINSLSQQQPDYNAAQEAIKKAKSYI
ncbi:MAG: hypothetical protein QXW01_01275 [Candidatus Aenigmatarchaeota archaeon]